MFENLSDRLERSFKILKGEGKITEINVAETLKDVRRALLDADVNYKVAKSFTDTVKQKAMGMNVLTAVKPSQLMVKIVHDELAELMGGKAAELKVEGRPGAPAIILMSGSMFVMWLGERITDRGIGNGISLLIMIGIVARLPYALVAEFGTKFATTAGGGPIALIVELIIWFLVIVATIALVQAVRKVPVQYAKRVIGNRQYGGVRQYIPLKINAAGVMPIIFAQALMLFPLLFSRFDATRGVAAALSNYTGFWYNLVFGLMVVIFTYFYTAVTVNPTMMAEDMKKNGGFIPGVKPGKATVNYLDEIMSRVTLPGSIFLAIIAILPAFARIAGVNDSFASFYGGTSLLILVGVVLDTLQQVESYLLMRHYDGLMKTGRISGRSGM